MVKEDIREGRFFFGGLEIVEVNSRIGKGLVGRCKHRERTSSLEGGDQVDVGERSHQ